MHHYMPLRKKTFSTYFFFFYFLESVQNEDNEAGSQALQQMKPPIKVGRRLSSLASAILSL